MAYKKGKKMTDNLPCANCGELTTAYYDGGIQGTYVSGKHHLTVKMCQKCMDGGWRPTFVWFGRHGPMLLDFQKK